MGISSSHVPASLQSPEKKTVDSCCLYQRHCIYLDSTLSLPVGLHVNSGLLFLRYKVQESVHMALFQELVWGTEQQYLFF